MGPETITAMNGGLVNIFNYDNIAIVVLMMVTVFEAIVIIVLLKALLSTKDVLSEVNTAISILNERLK